MAFLCVWSGWGGGEGAGAGVGVDGRGAGKVKKWPKHVDV